LIDIERAIADQKAVAECAAVAVSREIDGGEDEIKVCVVLQGDDPLCPCGFSFNVAPIDVCALVVGAAASGGLGWIGQRRSGPFARGDRRTPGVGSAGSSSRASATV